MSISHPASENMRGGTVAFLAPFWERVLSLKYFVSHPTQPSPFSTFSNDEKSQQLQVENQLLSTEIAYLHRLLNEQADLSSQIALLASIAPDEIHSLSTEHLKAAQRSLKQLKWNIKAVPARVIFRSFDTWNSTLWINIGETANTPNQPLSIAKNSPVVIGRTIVGLIDFVGKNYSRVRLITDSSLTPSVRAVRGGEQELLMHQYLEGLLGQINRKKQLPLSPNDQTQLVQLLKELKETIQPSVKSWYLAKGELHGSPSFTRQSLDPILKGTGFNYDFPDAEGTGRDLRTGKPLQNTQEKAVPILKVDDILVTTGMDGIFPPGFQVAAVTKVGLLKEGDYYYEIEAKPIAGALKELSVVFVLPPVAEGSIQNLGLK